MGVRERCQDKQGMQDSTKRHLFSMEKLEYIKQKNFSQIPSTTRTTPEIYVAPSEKRKTVELAISWTSPIRYL